MCSLAPRYQPPGPVRPRFGPTCCATRPFLSTISRLRYFFSSLWACLSAQISFGASKIDQVGIAWSRLIWAGRLWARSITASERHGGGLRTRSRVASNRVVVPAEVRPDQLALRAQGARGIHSGKCAFSVHQSPDTTKFCALATRPVMLRAMRPGLLRTSNISAVRVYSVQPPTMLRAICARRSICLLYTSPSPRDS